MALPKANRLKRRQDFSVVYQRGRRYRAPHLTLRLLHRSDQPISVPRSPRIGISISQKVSKRAVIRNRIKRQLRACLRIFLPQLVYGVDLVVLVHPEAVRCDYPQFLRELEQLLIDAEVLNER